MLWSAYGWTPAETADLTPAQIAYALEHLPLIEARKHYSAASLLASIKNMMGGKRPPKPPAPGEERDPPLTPEELYTAEEELPYFAYFEAPVRLTAEQAQVLVENFNRLPGWAQQVASIGEAHAVLA